MVLDRFGWGDHAQRRRADEPVGLDVPAGRAQDMEPSGRERDRIRTLATGDEPE